MQQENKKTNRLFKNLISVAVIVLFSGASVAIAALTFSNTSIVGDSSFTNVTGVVSSTWDFGAGTLSLQTASNSPITAGTGLFTINGTASSSQLRANSSTITGINFTNATGTNLSITNVSSTNMSLTAGQLLSSWSGVSGTAAFAFTGTPLATTTVSLLQVGSTIAGGSANGTYLGVNSASSFVGNFLDFQVNGISNFSVSGAGFASSSQLYVNSSTIVGVNFTNATGTGNLKIGTLITTGNTSVGTTTVNSLFTVSGSSTFIGQIVSTSTVGSQDTNTSATCGGLGGVAPTIVGSNGIGRFTTGSVATSSCVITFGTAFKNKPVCTVSAEAAATSTQWITPSATSLTVNAGSSTTAFGSLTIDYICIGQ